MVQKIYIIICVKIRKKFSKAFEILNVAFSRKNCHDHERHRITIREGTDAVGICFGHETYCSGVCSEVAKFLAKASSNSYRLEVIALHIRRSRFARKGHNWRLNVSSKLKPNHPNGKNQLRKDRKIENQRAFRQK